MVNLVASCTNAGCLVDKTLASSANTVLAIAISTAPLLSADLVAPACAWLVRLCRCSASLSELLRRVSAACEGFRLRREQAFVLIHGAVTYAIGDLIAQAAKAHGNGPACPVDAIKDGGAAGIGLLSDTLPFYHWSLPLATIDPQGKRAGVIQRVPL